MIINSLTVLIAIIALLLIIAVLIQNPKGGGIDSTYGSGANQMFGAARSADAIEKINWYLAAALFVLCIASYFFISKGTAANEIQLLSNPKG
jgi:preprotein translocase subunit SecG